MQNIRLDLEVARAVKGIITLAHALNLEVLAEGVEMPWQLEFLQAHACDAMQAISSVNRCRKRPSVQCWKHRRVEGRATGNRDQHRTLHHNRRVFHYIEAFLVLATDSDAK